MALTRPKYSQIYDTDWKQSVEIASTVDVGNLILGNTQPNSVDGVTILTNWRVLVKDQTNGAQNGIYVVRSAGTGSNGWWTRSLDAAQSNFVTAGLTVAVISGSVNGGKEFRLTTPDPITLGTTVLTFIDPNAAAGAGGANTQVQFNDLSTLAGSPGFTFNKFSNIATVVGNIVTTSGYFIGNGSQLQGLPAGYSNVQVATYLPTYTGVITSSNVFVTGNIIAQYIIGDGSQLTGIDSTSIKNSTNSFVITHTNGNVTVKGNLVPSANLVYDLGSPTQKWRSAYFGGNTVYVGSESISVAANGTWTFTSAGTNFNLGTNAVFNPPSANIAGNLNVGGAVTVSGNLSIEGNLFVNGNVTTINANNLNISDSLIYLADDNPADTIDIGFVSSFTPGGGSYQHTGFVRDASDGVWKLFAGVASEPTTTVDFTNASYSTIRVGNIYAGGTTANDNRFLQSTAGGLEWTAATSISSGTTSATADATSILVIASGVNSARFYGDIVYVYRDLELSANILVNGVGDFLGNVSAPYFVGDGSQLTGLPEGYSNVQVATYLPTYTGTVGAGGVELTNGNLNIYNNNGNIYIGDIVTGTVTTDVGVLFDGRQSIKSALFTEVNGNILSYAINMGQITSNISAIAGGIFRLDVRDASRKFVVVRRAAGSTVNEETFDILLDNGLGRFTSNLQVGRTATNYSNLTVAHSTPSTSTTTGALQVVGGVGINGNLNVGTADAVSGAFHTFVGNITQSTSGGAVYFNTSGNVSAATVLAGQFNTTGNILSTGASIFGNARLGLAGQVSGAFHTVVGNITQSTSGGAVYINTTGNILSTGAIHNSLTVNGATTINGNIFLNNSNGQYTIFGPSNLDPANGPANLALHQASGRTIMGWNYSAGRGEFAIICDRDGGSPGGLRVYDWSTANVRVANILMDINYSQGMTVAGNVLPNTSNTYTLGSTTAWWTTTFSKAMQAQYADLAEVYTSDQQYPAGTVVIFGGNAEVTQSRDSHDTRIAGVVSTDPAYLMNSTATGIPVALQGRVPCRVLGPVEQGDRVVSSHIPGVAQRLVPTEYEPGCIIGKALQAIDSAEISIIEVVVGRV